MDYKSIPMEQSGERCGFDALQGAFDSHCHLEQELEDREEIIAECKKYCMKGLISVCASPSDFEQAVQLAEKHPNFVHYTAGLHPFEGVKAAEQEIESYVVKIHDIFSEKNRPKPVAIGEMGLDYTLVKSSDIGRSKRNFLSFIDLANELDLPIIIHCRGAYSEVIETLKYSTKQKVVFHYFNQPEFTEEILNNGWTISLPFTLSRSKIKAVFEKATLDNMILETDSPIRLGDKRITPLNIGELARNISNVTSISEKEIVEKTSRNVSSIFKI